MLISCKADIILKARIVHFSWKNESNARKRQGRKFIRKNLLTQDFLRAKNFQIWRSREIAKPSIDTSAKQKSRSNIKKTSKRAYFHVRTAILTLLKTRNKTNNSRRRRKRGVVHKHQWAENAGGTSNASWISTCYIMNLLEAAHLSLLIPWILAIRSDLQLPIELIAVVR